MKYTVIYPNAQDLNELKRLVESGKIKTNIEKVIKLSELPQEMQYIENGHVQGKIVVSISDESF